MKTLLTLVILTFSAQLSPAMSPGPQRPEKPSPELVKVLKQINRNSPKLSKQYSMSLARTILAQSKKHKVSAKILTAMLMQESSYNISAKGLKCGISITTGEKDCVAVDYGIGQINHKTIKSFKFDEKKLLSNLDYSVEASAIVLADFKRMYGHKEDEYWTRYNASNSEKRQVYKTLVARYM